MKRRAFLSLAATTGLSALWPKWLSAKAPAIIISDKIRPQIPFGAQCGDIMADRAVIWSRSDIPARMIVEYSTTESFQNARRVVGPAAIESTDFTTRVDLAELPTGQKIFYRVTFQSPDDAKVFSETATGGFLTALNTKRDVSIAFGGDVCGQGSIPYSAELRFTRRCGACAPISSCIPAMRFTPTTESSRRN